MHTETATEVKNSFGKMMDKAQREPVIIEKSGRKMVVMIAYEDYAEFMAFRDKQWALKAKQAKQKGMAGKKKSAALLKKLLDA